MARTSTPTDRSPTSPAAGENVESIRGGTVEESLKFKSSSRIFELHWGFVIFLPVLAWLIVVRWMFCHAWKKSRKVWRMATKYGYWILRSVARSSLRQHAVFAGAKPKLLVFSSNVTFPSSEVLVDAKYRRLTRRKKTKHRQKPNPTTLEVPTSSLENTFASPIHMFQRSSSNHSPIRLDDTPRRIPPRISIQRAMSKWNPASHWQHLWEPYTPETFPSLNEADPAASKRIAPRIRPPSSWRPPSAKTGRSFLSSRFSRGGYASRSSLIASSSQPSARYSSVSREVLQQMDLLEEDTDSISLTKHQLVNAANVSHTFRNTKKPLNFSTTTPTSDWYHPSRPDIPNPASSASSPSSCLMQMVFFDSTNRREERMKCDEQIKVS